MCVAHDSAGDVLFAAAGSLMDQSEALHVETTGLLNTTRLAEEFGMGRVIFATDCLPLKQALDSRTSWMLRLWFSPRACNVPTHKLAIHGARAQVRSQLVWLSDLPLDVSVAVADDSEATTS